MNIFKYNFKLQCSRVIYKLSVTGSYQLRNFKGGHFSVLLRYLYRLKSCVLLLSEVRTCLQRPSSQGSSVALDKARVWNPNLLIRKPNGYCDPDSFLCAIFEMYIKSLRISNLFTDFIVCMPSYKNKFWIKHFVSFTGWKLCWRIEGVWSESTIFIILIWW